MNITYEKMLEMSASELTDILAEYIYTPIPVAITSPDDMLKAGEILAEITNKYSYFMAVLMRMKIRVRELRKDGSKKQEYDEMMGRRDSVEACTQILKQYYAGLSRMVSTRQEALKEINMSTPVT